eukprot:1858620-Rhodomonas_salina.1
MTPPIHGATLGLHQDRIGVYAVEYANLDSDNAFHVPCRRQTTHISGANDDCNCVLALPEQARHIGFGEV